MLQHPILDGDMPALASFDQQCLSASCPLHSPSQRPTPHVAIHTVLLTQHSRQPAAQFGLQTCKGSVFVTHEVGASTHIILTALEAGFKLGPHAADLPGVLMIVPTEAGPDRCLAAQLKAWLCS